MKIMMPSIYECFDEREKCVIIGNFDGIHQGHHFLFKNLEEEKILKAAITFSNNKFKSHTFLTPLEEKISYISENFAIDYLIVFEYNSNFIQHSAEEFIQFLLKNRVMKVICQEEFRFGRNQLGDVNLLKKNFEVKILDTIYDHSNKISSTMIRSALDNGNIRKANSLLGRNYKIHGRIIEGLKIGRTIGFPTINIDSSDFFLPMNGVYAVQIRLKNLFYLGMANIGLNPTVSINQIIKFEVHIFDFEEYIYNEEADIYFLDFIREERKFLNLFELKEELKRNKQKILENFSN